MNLLCGLRERWQVEGENKNGKKDPLRYAVSVDLPWADW